MKRAALWFVVLVLSGPAVVSAQVLDTLGAQREAGDSARTWTLRTIPQQAFTVGERLVFDVGYSFITAGEAVMSVSSIDTMVGRPVYRIVFTVNSTPTFSFFFKVEDEYESDVDVEGLFPWQYRQKIHEGKYRRDFEAQFDQIRHVARAEGKEYPIPPYVHDILSAFYYVRTLEFKGMRIGQKTYLQNFYKDSTYLLAVKFLGYQRIEVGAGTFDCVLVEPLIREGGLFRSEGRVIIWLSNDERKIPVKVSTQVIIGSIDAELKEFTGVRGPVPSRVLR
jgi:hypothetical protein